MTTVEQGVAHIKANVLRFGADPDEALRVIRWFDRALDAEDEVTRGLVWLVIQGVAILSRYPPEGPVFTLTEAGRGQAIELLETSPYAREIVKRITDRNLVEAPRRPQ